MKVDWKDGIIIRAALLAGLAACGTSFGGVVEDFRARLDPMEKNIPNITRAAEVYADDVVKHPDAILWAVWDDENGFFDELYNRSGGLARVVPAGQYTNTPPTTHDFVLAGISAWNDTQTSSNLFDKYVMYKNDPPKTLVLFASKAGMPKNIKGRKPQGEIAFLIDNFAPSGEKRLARVNHLANIMNAVMWVCEYTSAMTRRGKYPGILHSIQAPGGQEWSARLQAGNGRYQMFDYAGTPIPAGSLATQYVARVRRLLADLSDQKTEEQLAKAAELAAARMKAGRHVGITGCCHAFGVDMLNDHIAGFKAFPNYYGDTGTFQANLTNGDLLIWFSYVGLMNNVEQHIREAGLDYIPCYVPISNGVAHVDPNWSWANPSNALAQIHQHWTSPDSEIDIPFPPNKMAAVSGLNQILLYHMLDEKIAARLKKTGQTDKIAAEYRDEVK